MGEEMNKKISIRLSKVMDVIGANEELIYFRRHMYLVLEQIWSFDNKSWTGEWVRHIFGSQIEGSTTLGMQSDIDILSYAKDTTVCVDLSDFDFKKSKFNLLIIKDAINYPQCCCLQVVKMVGNTPEPLFENTLNEESNPSTKFFLFDHHGRCLIYKTFVPSPKFLENNGGLFLTEPKLTGPAVTIISENGATDFVLCFRCMSLPDECRIVFTRPKPGHWPKQGTLLKLKECEVYVLQSGIRKNKFVYDNERCLGCMLIHYPHKYADMQFRISTNMMERLLMFDIDPVQMKAYIMTKILRKELLSNDVGDSLSTFHMKTALLFTVEQFPEYIWRDDNLVQCIIYCLNTLCRFLKRRYCPHYTIANVNLFAGKLNVYELQSLKDKCTAWIHSSLECVQTLHMDNIGKRLSRNLGLIYDTIESRNEMCLEIIKRWMFVIADTFSGTVLSDSDLVSAASTEHPEYSTEIKHIFKLLCCKRASQRASTCLENDNIISCDIINMYETSINGSTFIPNYIKYASMLVCSHQFARANMLLEIIEKRFKSEMEQRPCNVSREERSNLCTATEMFMRCVTEYMSVMFERDELNCVPNHLLCEKCIPMSCKQAEPIINMPLSKYTLIADARPFFYYLQYLSSANCAKKKHAINKLAKYCYYELQVKTRDDLAMSFNMFGHLLELSNHIPGALTMYTISLDCLSDYNAALWHKCRLHMRDDNVQVIITKRDDNVQVIITAV